MGISRPSFTTTADVVAWHGAIQAQDVNGVLWSIALRRSDLPTFNQVRQSLEDERIVRTWPMRGTLHLVHASDVRWMLTMLSPRMETAERTRMAQLELTEDDISRCREAVIRKLADRAPVTRADLYSVFEQEGVPASGQRGYHIAVRLARDQVICGGPAIGTKPSFVLLDSWLGSIESHTPSDPLGTLARTYIWSHGPVTAADFSRWAGLPLGQARVGFAANERDCRVDEFEGSRYWSSADAEFAAAAEPAVHLLPGFDEFVLGYKDRGLFLAPAWQDRIAPGGNGVFRSTIVWNSRVVGTWSRKVYPRRVEVAAEWWANPTAKMRAGFAQRAEQFAAFMELPLKLSTQAC